MQVLQVQQLRYLRYYTHRWMPLRPGTAPSVILTLPACLCSTVIYTREWVYPYIRSAILKLDGNMHHIITQFTRPISPPELLARRCISLRSQRRWRIHFQNDDIKCHKMKLL